MSDILQENQLIKTDKKEQPIKDSFLKNSKKRLGKSTKLSSLALKQTKDNLKRFINILEIASKRDVNESDTSNIINDILGDVLGYDKFFDVTTEYKIKGQYADYGIRVNNKIYAFVEVKAINIELNENHLFQVASYAVHEGVDWAILTNGNVWRLYKIENNKPIKLTLVLSIDLFDKDIKYIKKAELFAAFHKKSLTTGYVEGLWKEASCVNVPTISKILCSKKGLEFIRRELKRIYKQKVDLQKIEKIINDEIINHVIKK